MDAYRAHLLLLTLLLAACTPHGMMDHPQVTSEEAFIAEMIPHHQEAVDTSRLMLDSADPAVVALATAIIRTQEDEIAMMQGWMERWYPDSAYVSVYTPMMPDLTALSGDARDTAYLQGMIAHHSGAIEMAKQARAHDLRPEVRALAGAIITTQTDEIALIERLLTAS